jgi:hypothetical protein
LEPIGCPIKSSPFHRVPGSVWQPYGILFGFVYLSMPFPSGSYTMPVILDNIQFYHGPSKPENPPYFAFNSKEKGSNTLLSGEQPPFSNEQVSSAADDPTIVPTCFIPPAAKAEDVTHQHAVGSPNFFDFELSRCQGSATPLLGTLEASHRDACPSLQRLYCHYRDNPDEEMPGDCKFTKVRASLLSKLLINFGI